MAFLETSIFDSDLIVIPINCTGIARGELAKELKVAGDLEIKPIITHALEGLNEYTITLFPPL